MPTTDILQRLLSSDEPSVRYKALVGILGRNPESQEASDAREAIRSSSRVALLLSLRQSDGRIPGDPYAKYTGAHWVLAVLADLGYPRGDASLLPLRDQVYELLLSPSHVRERIVERESAAYKSRPGVPIIEGRARRCASQEGNALYATLALGLADARADQLAENLIRWQWPDGGWNCDRKASATHSSFMETLAPLRGLALYARLTGRTEPSHAAARASEVFLKRGLYKRQRDGAIMHEDFIKLHYPCYWQYDILYALKVMAEAGYLVDPRCSDALDLLSAKHLPDGGFPAERKHYRHSAEPQRGGSLVDWGGTSRRRSNEFVTVDALTVLKAAGRLEVQPTADNERA